MDAVIQVEDPEQIPDTWRDHVFVRGDMHASLPTETFVVVQNINGVGELADGNGVRFFTDTTLTIEKAVDVENEDVSLVAGVEDASELDGVRL